MATGLFGYLGYDMVRQIEHLPDMPPDRLGVPDAILLRPTIVAVFDTALLWWLGIPLPLLWGLLSFITNYIPNIGFIVGVIPPALLGLLEGGPQLMMWVIVLYCVVNFIIQSVIQPKIVGDAVGLSATVTFLSLIFWGWVLGALGALLAIPLTLLAKGLLIDVDPSTRWLNSLLAGGPPARDEVPDEPPADHDGHDDLHGMEVRRT